MSNWYLDPRSIQAQESARTAAYEAGVAQNKAIQDTGAANLARIQAEQAAAAAQRKLKAAEQKLKNAQNGDPERLASVQQKNQELEAINQQLGAALLQKDALILEWMHSNEAFKQLARNYGKKLGITDEQRQEDFDNQLLNTAEENPQFQDTKKTAGAKQRLSQTPKP